MKVIMTSFLMLMSIIVLAQINYQLPPKEILDLADVKTPPLTIISRNNTYLLTLERPLYKSLEELAEPELRLAGLRINPENFNRSRGTYYSGLNVQMLKDGKTTL